MESQDRPNPEEQRHRIDKVVESHCLPSQEENMVHKKWIDIKQRQRTMLKRQMLPTTIKDKKL